ncbi:MAG: cytidylate kinase-like family protein [Bacteroidales bacterium]|nr:cytidylate kinase-like family protein [Bacteroidales bacterium]
MDNKILISIGRQLGAGGLEVAAALSERLGIKVYDRDLLTQAAKANGLGSDIFERRDERPISLGRFWRVFGLRGSYVEAQMYLPDTVTSDDSIFRLQSQVMLDIAGQGSGIFVGRCSDYILRDAPELLSVFITADMSDRVERIMKRDGMTRREAEHFIEHGDRQRASYYNYYTFKEWGNSSSYDLCISSSTFGIDGAADCIVQMLDKKYRESK